MMNPKYNLSGQETFLMDIFWSTNKEMSLSEISQLASEAGFKPTVVTTKTYLRRLIEKGALDAYKVGHGLRYFAAMPETEYKKKWTRSILEKSFNGSLNSFICALTGNKKLTEEERKILEELYHE